MALKADYKDDIFSGARKYMQVNNADNTKSFLDVTEYSQEGDYFGANEVNEMAAEINRIAEEFPSKDIYLTISNNWEGSTAPYTQNITVDGILSTDNPIVDVILSDSLDTAILEEKAWGNISKIVTNDGSITAICNKKKPVTGVRIQLKVVR